MKHINSYKFFDDEYLAAVKRQDMKKLKSLVKNKAAEAGYNIGPVYHGTDNKFTFFDIKKVSFLLNGEDNMHFYFAFDKKNAMSPKSSYSKPKYVISAYLKCDVDGHYDDQDRLTPKNANCVILGDFTVSVKYAHQIKSADPITYDNDGNVIPLSSRFNSKKKDFRY